MNLYDIVAPLTVAEAKTDYEKRRQRERDVDASKPVAKQRPSKMTDYQKKRAQDKRDMELGEDSWHAGDNAWSSEQHEMVEGATVAYITTYFDTKSGDKGESTVSALTREEAADKIVALMHERGYDVVVTGVRPAVDEGWSNKMVARRTGQAPTPYSVYIKGKEWKSFPDDDHAENVANKLRAKFKHEGRDPSVITIAATGYDKDIKEDWIDDDAAEPLARYFADLYYGDFSATEKVKLTSHIYQAVINGELSIDQLKADIDMLEKEKGLKEGDDFGHLEPEIFARIDAEKKRLADLKKNDPAAYAREMAKERSRRRIPAVSTFEDANDTYNIIRTNDYGKKDVFAGNYSLDQAKDELAKCLAHPLHTKYGHKFEIVKRNNQVNEFAPGGTIKPPAPPTAKKRDPFEDDDRSQLLMSIKQLLDKGAKIDSYLFGARGHITGVSPDYFGFTFKKLNKPHSKSGFVRPMDGDDDDSYMLKMVKPGYYQLWDKSIANAGEEVKEGGIGEPEHDLRRKLQRQIGDIELLDFYITDDDGLIVAGPFFGRSQAHAAFEKLVRQRQDINVIQGRALIVKLSGLREGVAEGDETSWTANSTKFGAGYEAWPVQQVVIDKLVAKYLPWVKKEIANGGRADSALNSVEHHLQKTEHLGNYNQVKQVISAISKQVDGPFHKEPFAEDVSGLSDTEYNTVARYAKSKYPAMVLAALGRNPDGSVNVRMHDTKGLGITKEFKVRFRDPEETKLDELSPQTLKSYIKKSKGHSQKYDQKGNKADEKGDEELANKMWNKGDNRYAGAEQARAKLAGVNENTNYWTKLQNERSTKLNTLVNELKESIKK